MEPNLIGLLGFVGMLGLIVLGVPIAFAMLVTACVGLFAVGGPNHAETQIAITFTDVGANFVMVAVPLYFMMGQIVQRTNIAYDLYECVYRWLGRLPGGLAISSVVACAGFGAICGSSLATAATMGKVALPELRRLGYSGALSTGSLAAGGTLGILIPPSVILIIYAILTEQNIAKMFLCAFIPGIIAAIGYIAAIAIYVRINKDAGPTNNRIGWKKRLHLFKNIWHIIIIFVVMIGGIYEQTSTKGSSKTPILSDIPVFGNLFKSVTKDDKLDRLLIFIAPRIL